jgi:PIN domain nuclease of toxin-antitoxin system
VKILLDTHVFLWAITDDPRLSITHRAVWQDGRHDLHLSVASMWEMLIKAGIGKLPLPRPAAQYVQKQAEKNRLHILAIHAGHVVELEDLPPLHKDPFDRMLVAQARREKMPLMTADPAVKAYKVEVI